MVREGLRQVAELGGAEKSPACGPHFHTGWGVSFPAAWVSEISARGGSSSSVAPFSSFRWQNRQESP